MPSLRSPRSLLVALLALSLWLSAASSDAHPVTVDGSPREWFTREANGDNLGLVARDASGLGEFVWRDAAGDTRTDVDYPETIADLTRVRVTGNATGLCFLFTLADALATVGVNPVQIQVAIDVDRVVGSGQTYFAGFADTSVAPAATWEYLVQTQFSVGSEALVYDRSFATVGAPLTVGAVSGTGTVVEFVVPWSRLGLAAPPTTAIRLTIATFRERAGGFTVDLGGPSVPNALDVLSDHGAPSVTGPHPNTYAEFIAAGDLTVDDSVDVWMTAAGEPYAPLLMTRFVSNAVEGTEHGGDWIMLRNMTPAPLPLAGFRVTDEESAGGVEGAIILPSAASLPVGGVYVIAANGTAHAGRFGVPADAEWGSTDATPDLVADPVWGHGALALDDDGDELMVLDASYTAVDIVTYGAGSYAGVTSMGAPAVDAAASRNQSTFADTDRCDADFTASTALCANSSECGVCGQCALRVCAPRAAGFRCRVPIGECDALESCDGVAMTCPADAFLPSTTVCRASSGVCDRQETCTGSSATCPADGFMPSTTVCRVNAGLCDVPENCSGSTSNCPPNAFAPSTTVCRVNNGGGCDAAENCTGSGVACPADTGRPTGTVCRASAGPCDPAETCNGSTAPCPSNTLASAGTVCRASVGACDPAEACTGSSVACPADVFAVEGTTCRASVGVCDRAETCTGSSGTCPADSFASSSTVCRSAAGACDVAEACTGSSAACPQDLLADALTVCRESVGACDVVETCSGASGLCPSDAFAPTTTVCRASNGGGCDVAETCTGSSAVCPVDRGVAADTTCRAAGGACDVAESCDGTSAPCPADSLLPSTTVCRASSGGGCDVAETCTGSGATCPADVGSSAGTVCRAAAGPCDVAESCDGTAAPCPSDSFGATTTVCRLAVGACDLAETCDGASTACPANRVLAMGAPCADGLRCNGDETCDGAGACRPGAPPICTPSASVCRTSVCSEAAGGCTFLSAPTGTPCGDGDSCNGDETCNASGFCVMGTPRTDGGALCADAGPDAADAADVVDVVDAIDAVDAVDAVDVVDAVDAADDVVTRDVAGEEVDAPLDGMIEDVSAVDAEGLDVPVMGVDATDAMTDVPAASDASSVDVPLVMDTSTQDAADERPAPDTGVDVEDDASNPRSTGSDAGCGCRTSTHDVPFQIPGGSMILLALGLCRRRRCRVRCAPSSRRSTPP